MRKTVAVVCLLLFSVPVVAASHATVDMADSVSYRNVHTEVVGGLVEDLRSPERVSELVSLLGHDQHEVALKDLCPACARVASTRGMDREFEPSVWLYEPTARARPVPGVGQMLIAFPPSGPRRAWTTVSAMTLNGEPRVLDAHKAPDVPVLVVRINGRLSMHKQLAMANARLRAAGMQVTTPTLAGTGHWTTRLESIRLNDDEEPWISGGAEIYAITSGVLAGNQPQIQVVDMPYIDYDGVTYNPRQIVLDWNNYAYGVANIQLFEHDDNTNYTTLLTSIINAIGAAGSLAGYPVIGAIAEIANRIVDAIPDEWLTNDDDYVDSFYTIEKVRGATRWGARGNALISYIPYELPPN